MHFHGHMVGSEFSSNKGPTTFERLRRTRSELVSFVFLNSQRLSLVRGSSCAASDRIGKFDYRAVLLARIIKKKVH